MFTKRQKEVLDFITEYIKSHGFGPTLNEINKKFKMGSTSAAHQHVAALQRKGFLKKLPYQTRAISLYQKLEGAKEIPLVGRIALGEPIESSFEQKETIKVPDVLLSGNGHYYALEAKGNSMNEDGILNGDLIIVKQSNTAENGDVVIARTADGATLKKFYNHGDKIELKPKSDDSKHASKFFPFGEVEIQGKFSGLIRRG
jgi:repressor LexA